MSKFQEMNQKIEDAVVGGYRKIEDTVVNGYQKIEDTVVEGYKKVEDRFIGSFLIREGETIEQARARMKGENVKEK